MVQPPGYTGYKPISIPLPGKPQPDMNQLIEELIKKYANKDTASSGGGGGGGGGSAAGGAGGGAAVASQVGGGNANLAATPGANALWNAQAMDASEGGQTLMDSAGAVPEEFSMAPAVPYVAAAAGTYLTAKGLSNVARHKKESNLQRAVTDSNPMTVLPNELGRALIGGKSNAQKGRDANRAFLKGNGVFDNNYDYTLSDGSKVNMGKEGKGVDYTFDPTDMPNGDKIIAYIDPLSDIVSGGDQKKRSDLTVAFANAFKNSKDPIAEIKNLYKKAGVDHTALEQHISANPDFDPHLADAYRNSLNGLFGSPSNGSQSVMQVAPPTQKPGSSIATPLPGKLNPNSPGIRDGVYITGRDGPAPSWLPAATNTFNGGLNNLVRPLSKPPVNNPNSPGFRNGKRI